MFLRKENSGELVRVEDVDELTNPLTAQVKARLQSGEEEQDSEAFHKSGLVFPSGEPLPQCWTQIAYQANALRSADRD